MTFSDSWIKHTVVWVDVPLAFFLSSSKLLHLFNHLLLLLLVSGLSPDPLPQGLTNQTLFGHLTKFYANIRISGSPYSLSTRFQWEYRKKTESLAGMTAGIQSWKETLCARSVTHVWLSARSPWTVACQAPLSKGLSRQ